MSGRGRGGRRGGRGGGRGGGRAGRKPEKSDDNAGVIGYIDTPLSERFASLHETTTTKPTKNARATALTKQVATKVQAVQKAKRQNTINARRGIAAPEPTVAQTKVKKPVLTKTPAGVRVNMRGRGRGRGRGGRGGRGERGPSAKPEDLDLEMDTYWHEGGKGPDPKQAQLDRQMEQYWADKPAQATAGGDNQTANE
ncbi:Aste57867_14723 [Aphanomyces stellatus]|uniref:Aste57867_14723 protein n=1 Tax=Aphanomyces stellatus TaxID=120398 RepID=A0A485L1F0_9STRA|nr:hypothetical protein As57867_014668 [Aphanomyces stellatus]VFT91541.1 Aste57867_14723 [Aphanomyces stellatus]